jgi:hypothetical protein
MKNSKIVAVYPTQNASKVRIEVSQEVQKQGVNVLALLNKSDARFTQSRPILAWVTAEAEDLVAMFPKLKTAVAEAQTTMKKVDLANHVDFIIDGIAGNIRIVESHIATQWQSENLDKSAKRAGKDGDFLVTDDNFLIFRKTEVVLGEAKNELIPFTARVSDSSEAFYLMKDGEEIVVMQNGSIYETQELVLEESSVEDFA